MRMGNHAIKNRVALTPRNFMERVLHFFIFKYGGSLLSYSLVDVVLAMVRTGKFYPGSNWFIPYQARGMDYEKAEAAFRMMVQPSSVCAGDVQRVFFDMSKARPLEAGWWYDREPFVRRGPPRPHGTTFGDDFIPAVSPSTSASSGALASDAMSRLVSICSLTPSEPSFSFEGHEEDIEEDRSARDSGASAFASSEDASSPPSSATEPEHEFTGSELASESESEFDSE